MSGSAIILTHLVASAMPVLSIDMAMLNDHAVTGGRGPGQPTATNITEPITSPPVSLFKASRGFVSDAEPDEQQRVALELDRVSRTLISR